MQCGVVEGEGRVYGRNESVGMQLRVVLPRPELESGSSGPHFYTSATPLGSIFFHNKRAIHAGVMQD